MSTQQVSVSGEDAIGSRIAAQPGFTSDGSAVVRAAVSTLVGFPFLFAGTVFIFRGLSWEAALVIPAGVAVVLLGLYVGAAGSRPRPDLVPGEKTLALCHPASTPAFARIVVSLVLFVVAGVLFEWTEVPYVYPFVFFLWAMYTYFRGVSRYWMNRHTVYYVTDRRAVQKYQFAWLRTIEVPVTRINTICLAETMMGHGSVLIDSGRQPVRFQEIDDPKSLVDILREQVPDPPSDGWIWSLCPRRRRWRTGGRRRCGSRWGGGWRSRRTRPIRSGSGCCG